MFNTTRTEPQLTRSCLLLLKPASVSVFLIFSVSDTVIPDTAYCLTRIILSKHIDLGLVIFIWCRVRISQWATGVLRIFKLRFSHPGAFHSSCVYLYPQMTAASIFPSGKLQAPDEHVWLLAACPPLSASLPPLTRLHKFVCIVSANKPTGDTARRFNV